MKKYSLRTIILFSFLIIGIGTATIVYFFIDQHKQELIDAAINEKTHLAQVVDETMTSPEWVYRLALVPGMERAFLSELASFRDVLFIRVVNQDGTVYKSNIESEWGSIIEDSDISRVIREREKRVKDYEFRGEDIKVIIYPGHQGKTVWIGFSMEGVEGEIYHMWIRDLFITWGGILVLILVLFLLVEHNIIIPVKEIMSTCKEVRKGNLKARVKNIPRTEIGDFAESFNKTVSELKKSKDALEESKAVLEIKVRARTRELEEFAETLEDKVKERTEELESRIKELERFHKLTVGRETKMIELKKEIKDLKEKLSKKKTKKKKS